MRSALCLTDYSVYSQKKNQWQVSHPCFSAISLIMELRSNITLNITLNIPAISNPLASNDQQPLNDHVTFVQGVPYIRSSPIAFFHRTATTAMAHFFDECIPIYSPHNNPLATWTVLRRLGHVWMLFSRHLNHSASELGFYLGESGAGTRLLLVARLGQG